MTEMSPQEFASILMETGLMQYAGKEHAALHQRMSDLFNGLAQAYYSMGLEDAELATHNDGVANA